MIRASFKYDPENGPSRAHRALFTASTLHPLPEGQLHQFVVEGGVTGTRLGVVPFL